MKIEKFNENLKNNKYDIYESGTFSIYDGNIKKMISWLGKEDSPLLIKPKFDWNQISWFSKFLIECFPKNNHQNIKDMLELSLFSRQTLQEIRKNHNLKYEEQTNGILTFYTSQKSFNDGINSANFMKKF